MISSNPTENLKLLISLVAIGQQLLIALLFLKSRPLVAGQWLGALLLMGASAYLIRSNTALMEFMEPVGMLIRALSVAIPYLLWEFSIAIFEIRAMRLAARCLIYLVPVALIICVANEGACPSRTIEILGSLQRIFGIGVLAHIVVSVYVDRGDDLLEPRRRCRAMFLLLIAVQSAAIMAIEIFLGSSAFPAWLDLINVILIALLTLGLSLPMLTLDGGILWQAPIGSESDEELSPASGISPAERVLKDALAALMQAGFYRTSDLKISGLAEKLSVPEHQLRRLINQQLGYRNFSSFLNHHRIGEAQLCLANAEMVRIPVLTMAMDLGYGSIGPLNRAFKKATGVTPTEFRQQKLGQSTTDSEKV